MAFIPMRILEYRLSEEGIIEEIIVGFQKYDGDQRFDVRFKMTQEAVSSINDRLELRTMNQAQVENISRRLLANDILKQRPEEPEEPENVEEPEEPVEE